MKASLDEHGRLLIQGETPVETYALVHWFADWNKPLGEQKAVLQVAVPVGEIGIGYETVRPVT